MRTSRASGKPRRRLDCRFFLRRSSQKLGPIIPATKRTAAAGSACIGGRILVVVRPTPTTVAMPSKASLTPRKMCIAWRWYSPAWTRRARSLVRSSSSSGTMILPIFGKAALAICATVSTFSSGRARPAISPIRASSFDPVLDR